MEATMPAGLPKEPETIHKYTTWFLIYGIALILLGAAAIIAPGIATLAAATLIGWLLFASGIIGLVAVFRAGTSAPGFSWKILTAIIFLLAGTALLWNPIVGALTFTLILAAFLLAMGITKFVTALGYRKTIPQAWGWMLFSAAIDGALGVLIVSGLPGTTVWILGLLVGINLLFTGTALVAAAIAVRRTGDSTTSLPS
jgi:uncharacterized membrane protein HdeD (DUF308 family)